MPRSLQKERASGAVPLKPAPSKPKQPGCLVVWLIGMVLFGAYSAYLWTTLMPVLEQIYPTWLVYIALGVLLLQIFAALGVLMRKRWSVVLLIAALSINLVLRAGMGAALEDSLAALAFSAIILWAFVRPNWAYYT